MYAIGCEGERTQSLVQHMNGEFVEGMQCAVAIAPKSRGWVAFFGDVNAERCSLQTIALLMYGASLAKRPQSQFSTTKKNKKRKKKKRKDQAKVVEQENREEKQVRKEVQRQPSVDTARARENQSTKVLQCSCCHQFLHRKKHFSWNQQMKGCSRRCKACVNPALG